jgi:hypothetical protein
MKQTNLIIAMFLIAGCRATTPEDKGTKGNIYTTDHYNITIASDLSNRLNPKIYPKAVSDVQIVNTVVEDFYPKIVKHKRSMNQLDQLRVDFINKKQINQFGVNTKAMNLDLAVFKTQGERIGYLRSNYQTNKTVFLSEVKRVYTSATARPSGSDIWTYLQAGVDSFIVNKEVSTGKIGETSFTNRYRNILILTTDGYLETKFDNSGYELSAKKIAEFRKSFLKSGESNIESFYSKNKQYKIKPLTNPLIADLEILVLELYDRTETIDGASVHPTDLEIIKMIWSDWFKSSKIKRFELHPKFSNRMEAEKVIAKFIGI